jgi:SAM-dependent methyltransferase
VPEPSWGEGYVVDVSYAHGFYGELAPSALAFTALLGGVRPPAFESPYVYYELGCGQGGTTAVLAAANPRGRFYGIDFNPTHIHNARALAAATGLDNATFLEKSFAELAGMDLPDADVVALHGVWSWVSAENRAHIVEFLRRRLKPGGLALVSYNALPGLAQLAPLQRLLAEHARAGAGERMERMRRAVQFAQRLEQAGAYYFVASPLARTRLGRLARQNAAYVAHEYLNAQWTPFYHADVAQDLLQAKLGYAASAITLDNFSQFVLKPELAALAGEAPDRVAAETLKDFGRNCVFRKDLFTRGAPKAAPQELEAALDAMRFALARPRPRCRLALNTTAGEVSLQPDVHAPVLDALARRPMTYRELLVECAGMDRSRLRQVLYGLAALDNVVAALPAEGEPQRKARTDRFNAAALAGSAAEYSVLASPVTGSGLPLPLFERLFLTSGKSGEDAVAHAHAALAAAGLRMRGEERPLESEAEGMKVLRERAERFFGELLPYCRLLGAA